MSILYRKIPKSRVSLQRTVLTTRVEIDKKSEKKILRNTRKLQLIMKEKVERSKYFCEDKTLQLFL